MKKTSILAHSEEETFQIAGKLAKNLKGDEILLLTGELGAGKTVFTKGLCFGLGLKTNNHVCSPSYTLVNVYDAKFRIFHIDLYRLVSKADIEDLGWEDYIGEGIIIVEWGEKMEIKFDCIRVRIEVLAGNKRKIFIEDPFDGSHYKGA